MTLTLEELKQTREWQLLNDNEQAFLLEYVANGFNASQAASKVFNTGSAKSATVYGRRVLDRPRVAATLARMGGCDTIAESEIWDALRQAMKQNDSPQAKVQAIRLAAELSGMMPNKDGTPPQLSQGQLPKELVQMVAERLGEMPVGRIMKKLGVEEMKFLPEGDRDAAHETQGEQARESNPE